MKHLQIFFALSVLLVLAFSCKQTSDEVIDLNDVVQKAAYDTLQRKDTTVELTTFIPALDQELLEESAIRWDSVTQHDQPALLERFTPLETEKFNYYVGDNLVEYSRWTFSDSVKTMKAFMNWMNCFGTQCTMVELRQNKNIQRSPLLIMQNDTSIVLIESPRLSVNELQKWKKMYLAIDDIKWNFIVIQPKANIAKWSYFVDGEEKEFVQLENK